jgi:ABC-2 type transport system ATP-binding protein
MAVIEAAQLVKTYGPVRAVDGIDLRIEAGELFGLLGPNGSGKSTTVKLLTGQIPPDSGTIRVLDTDVIRDPVGARVRVGIIPEQETPPSFLTAEEYLHFVADVRRMGEEREERIGFWFDFLAFGSHRDQLCKDLSRGTRQKLMVAQAFLHEPPVAFIDEPLINLDPLMQRKVKDHLTGYVAAGNTVFFSTHILSIAEEICTRIGVLHQGSLLYTGTVASLKDEYGNLEAFFLARMGQAME